MGASNSNHNSMRFFVMKAKSKDIPRPYFGRKEKVDNEWKTTEQFDTFNGQLRSMELGSYEWNGKRVETLAMFMRDPDGSMSKIEMSFSNGLTRSIINSLASVDNISEGDFRMSVYVNKSDYSAVSCQMDGKKLSWKYEIKDFPQPRKVKVNSTTEVTDSEETDNFFREVVKNELMPQLEPVPSRDMGEEQHEAAPSGEPIDDLPF